MSHPIHIPDPIRLPGEKPQPLITEMEIQHRISELAREIARTFAEDFILVAVLKGSFIFVADLVRRFNELDLFPELEFIRAESYGSKTESHGEVHITEGLSRPIARRQVLLVDDILDTGLTLTKVYSHLQEGNPALLKSCVLLDKPSRRKAEFQADFVGFEIPDQFVVGFGMDYDERYRHLPYITAVENLSPRKK